MSIKRRSFIKKAGVYGSGLMAANTASMMLTKRASAAKRDHYDIHEIWNL